MENLKGTAAGKDGALGSYEVAISWRQRDALWESKVFLNGKQQFPPIGGRLTRGTSDTESAGNSMIERIVIDAISAGKWG